MRHLQRLAQIVVRALEQSAINNKRWIHRFIEKYGFDLKPQDSLSVGPAHYSPLWTLFQQDCEYLSDTLFDMLRAVLLQKSDPPPSILHVTNPIKEDADLRGSNTGRHWLADFDDTARKG